MEYDVNFIYTTQIIYCRTLSTHRSVLYLWFLYYSLLHNILRYRTGTLRVWERPVCKHLSIIGVTLGCRSGTRTHDIQNMSLMSYRLLYSAISVIKWSSLSLWTYYSTRSAVCQVLTKTQLITTLKRVLKDKFQSWVVSRTGVEPVSVFYGGSPNTKDSIRSDRLNHSTNGT